MKSTLKNLWFWITIVLLVFFIYRSCGKGNVSFFGCNKGDTLSHKIDTTVTENKDTSEVSFVPKQENETDTVYVPKWYKKEVHDTLEIPDDRPPIPITDTLKELRRLQAIERAYNKRNFFKSDSIRDKNKKWVAVVRDTTQRNVVIGTGLTVVTTCYDTTVKETTTILKHPLIVYVGLTGFGSKTDFLHGGIASIAVKGKNDMQYEFGIGKIRNEKETYYSVGVKAPIRLFGRKRK